MLRSSKFQSSGSLMSAQDLLLCLGDKGKHGFVDIQFSESPASKKAWKRRFIVLYGSMIQIYKDDKSEETLECISLLGYEKVKTLFLEKSQWCLCLFPLPTFSSLKRRTFSCSSNVSLQEWMHALERCIQRTNNEFDTLSGEHLKSSPAPRWENVDGQGYPVSQESSCSSDLDSASCHPSGPYQYLLLQPKQNLYSTSNSCEQNIATYGGNASGQHKFSVPFAPPPPPQSAFTKSTSLPSMPENLKRKPPAPLKEPSKFSDGFWFLPVEKEGQLTAENESVASCALDVENKSILSASTTKHIYENISDAISAIFRNKNYVTQLTNPISPFLQECLVTDPKLERNPDACEDFLKSTNRVGTYLIHKSIDGGELHLRVLTTNLSVITFALCGDMNSRIRLPECSQDMSIEEVLRYFTYKSIHPKLNHYLGHGVYKQMDEASHYEEIDSCKKKVGGGNSHTDSNTQLD